MLDLGGWLQFWNNFYYQIKCYQIAPHAMEEYFMKGRGNQYNKLHCCLILRDCDNCSSLQQSTAIFTEARPPPAK